MKKFIQVALVASVLCGSAVFALDSRIIATYKDGKVTEQQVVDQFKPVIDANFGGKSFSELDFEMQEFLVNNFINAKLLEADVSKQKITETKEFKEKIDNAAKQLAITELLGKIVAEKVTPALIEQEYEKIIAELKNQEEIKVSHILVATQKEANAIKNRLNNGEKFATLAKKLSKDEGSKAKGGEMSYMRKGQLDPVFEKAAFALKKGEVSAPVQTQFGWHIIKLEDKRPLQLPTKEKGMEFAKAKLGELAVVNYVDELNKNADVKILIEKPAQKAPAAKEEEAQSTTEAKKN